jgi:glycosyltransferase involved in cell wall biosynthesis
MKKRVLMVNEASFLNTGYANYGRELLNRLYDTGKYEIAELGCYGPPNDERHFSLRWNYISNMPDTNNKEEMEQYAAVVSNQFGQFKFEYACLSFRPQVVLSIRDHWMEDFIERSPFRRFYNWIYMPTVDAYPQNEEWISTFMDADAVFTYSDWSANVLREQSNGKIKLLGTASPGADAIFKPSGNKKENRKKLGIPPECYIVGTTMRNQKRKLLPDLIESFAEYMKTAPKQMAETTYLYMHTTWPDIGWDLPRLLNEFGVGHRCLFTYQCRYCRFVFPSFFIGAIGTCKRCKSIDARLPSVHDGVTREELCSILNLFDVYVQYSTCEGFGMPLVEAAACAVPVMAVDYSAMSDILDKLNGERIPVQRYFRESETYCLRALPDNKKFVEKLIKFFEMPEILRTNRGYNSMGAVDKHYNYDKTAKLWEQTIDSLPDKESWDSPPNIHNIPSGPPHEMTNDEFVSWGIKSVAGYPEWQKKFISLRMNRDLNWGMALPSMGGIYFHEDSVLGSQNRYQLFNREICLQELVKIGNHKNLWESRRAGHER